ncbi:sugar phosphate isomerase/epimerase [Vibrio lamellibrachiae]|uniref:sugar phosphate isomerase/epimerase family protein n=1 Tax=Vibrio lamellibrachiae TaxID=2910253 RepID=UPI003D0CA917
MKTIKGPALFLAQFISDEAPFNSLRGICQWAQSLGYKALQMPTNDTRFFDLERAANDLEYCDNLQATLNEFDLEISELSTHLQGQLIAVHPAYDELFDAFAPKSVQGNPKARQDWAVEQLFLAAKASQNLGLKAHATFSGSLLWPYLYPWPQRPSGLIDCGFNELASRWLPILEAFNDAGVDLCYEIHPGEDLHDGATFQRFLDAVDGHPRANILYDPSHFLLQQLDYLGFIDKFHDRIKMFHVKDAEFNSSALQGVYGGFESWADRAGRFRSLGDGQINFNAIFSKLTQHDFEGWAVVEWECSLKDPEQGAKEGALFVQDQIIQVTDKSFDDFAAVETDHQTNLRLLGIRQ